MKHKLTAELYLNLSFHILLFEQGNKVDLVSCILINQLPALLVKSTLQEQNKIIILISQCRNVLF